MLAFLKGFAHAFRGVRVAGKEKNLRVHYVASGLAFLLGLYYGITGTQWCFVFICVGWVISAEMKNTATELLADQVVELHGLGKNKSTRDIKDVAAGAVLVPAVASAIVAGIIFVPYMLGRS